MAELPETEIAKLGEFGLIDRLTAGLEKHNGSTVTAVGDDAAVMHINLFSNLSFLLIHLFPKQRRRKIPLRRIRQNCYHRLAFAQLLR